MLPRHALLTTREESIRGLIRRDQTNRGEESRVSRKVVELGMIILLSMRKPVVLKPTWHRTSGKRVKNLQVIYLVMTTQKPFNLLDVIHLPNPVHIINKGNLPEFKPKNWKFCDKEHLNTLTTPNYY